LWTFCRCYFPFWVFCCRSYLKRVRESRGSQRNCSFPE
jgi:hypothetical protein